MKLSIWFNSIHNLSRFARKLMSYCYWVTKNRSGDLKKLQLAKIIVQPIFWAIIMKEKYLWKISFSNHHRIICYNSVQHINSQIFLKGWDGFFTKLHHKPKTLCWSRTSKGGWLVRSMQRLRVLFKFNDISLGFHFQTSADLFESFRKIFKIKFSLNSDCRANFLLFSYWSLFPSY